MVAMPERDAWDRTFWMGVARTHAPPTSYVGYKTSLLSARGYVTTFVIMVYTMCSRFIDCYQEFLF